MGRFVKNSELTSRSYATRVPVGTDIIGPDWPQAGQFRFNQDKPSLEVYMNSSWYQLATVGSTNILKDTFYGDGITTDFAPMSVSYSAGEEASALVFVGNIFQDPGVAFTFSNYTISFTSPPGVDSPIVILHNFASTAAIV